MIVKSKPWNRQKAPRKVLALRFHALGDLMITLPFLASLKKNFPETSLTLLTRSEFSGVPQNLRLFDEVISFEDHRSGKLQLLLILLKLPSLWLKRFDVVLDLQNNFASSTLRKLLASRAWSEFDRSSKRSAADRTRSCIDALGLGDANLETYFVEKNRNQVDALLRKNGLERGKFVILNPCGVFSSRNWPLKRYSEFARLWSAKFPHDQFLTLGLQSMREKAAILKSTLGSRLVDLCGLTSQEEAFGLVSSAKLVLTEDGGLMHMAWVQGVPTVAIFGSTPSYWSAPQGAWSLCLNSSDLPCGDCMLATCKFNDNRCLTRYPSEMIFEKSISLLSTLGK